MRVRLAAQDLSDTVGNVLNEFGPPEAQFCLMMDTFFDCLNVSNREEWQEKQKDFLKPSESVDNVRFEWLDSFLFYFEQWKESIQNRDASNYTAHARSNIFISWQTHEGLQITVHSFKEVCKFLLEHGVPYIISEKFCQDDLENYFGGQRAIGSRRDNRDTINTIETQFSVRSIAG